MINAGDGPHEHHAGPARHLDDSQHNGRIEGLTVALVGDIAHSRTARWNIQGLQETWAPCDRVRPVDLVSPQWPELGVEVAHSLDESCRGATC